MAGGDETRDPEWGNLVAHKTFILTAIGAVLFVAAVVIFIFIADRGR
jgi:hypothetical protein